MRKLFLATLFVLFAQAKIYVDTFDTNHLWRIGTVSSIIAMLTTNVVNATEISQDIGATATGNNGEEADAYKLMFSWKQKDLLTFSNSELTFMYKFDLTRYQIIGQNEAQGSNISFGFIPSYRYQTHFGFVHPFVEAGIGVYWLAHPSFMGRELGSNFQFGHFFSMGSFIGNEMHWGLSYRIFHHSNYNLTRVNTTFNSQYITLHYYY